MYSCVLQCVAVCCSVLQCVAVCCSVLQCVTNTINNVFNTLAIIGITGLFYSIADNLKNPPTQKKLEHNISIGRQWDQGKIETSKNKLMLSGLLINETTNNGFTNIGIYLEINAGNEAKLEIESYDPAAGIKAKIKSVLMWGENFNIDDIITIPKSSIGGATSNLIINVL